MATNDITEETLKKRLNLNKETGVFTWNSTGKLAGYTNPDGYCFIRLNYRLYRVHRLVWLYEKGYFPSKELDHIDGNPSNNRLNNLRECSSSENKCNATLRKDNTSKIKGVHFYKAAQKWQVYLSYKKTRHFLGYYESFLDACCVIITARQKLHKEFAKHG
jgi:hypothetical protein